MTPTIEFHGQRIEPQAFQERYLRTAGALRAAGVGPGDVIVLMMRNSPLTLELMLAARWIGAQWCPVNG
ncbi:MAG: AMP-binding protein, partial [Burkholderiales bacterium]|nr:AMP-binding protein [Burkholderiales bacterium]